MSETEKMSSAENGMQGYDFDPDALRDKYRDERDKRMRPDGNEQYVEVKGDFSRYVDDPYVDPGFTREPLNDEVEVVIIGGGFGGLLAGARLREAGIESIRIIEKGGDFGGTWYWNRYPGAQCDIEAYIYLPLLEETGYIPKEKYSFAPEILEHSRRIGEKFDLYRDACFQTQIKEITLERGRMPLDHHHQSRRPHARALRGHVERTAEPAQAARHSRHRQLQGPHLPHQPLGLRLHRRRYHRESAQACATSASPSSAPARRRSNACRISRKDAQQLYVFQRTPSSVDERGNRPTDPEWAKTLTPGWQKRADGQLQRSSSPAVSAGRGSRQRRLDRHHPQPRRDRCRRRRIPPNDSPEEMARMMELADFKKMNQIRARVDAIVKDKATAEALKPWYRQFCKRPTFNDEYLPTFNRPNVTLVDTKGAASIASPRKAWCSTASSTRSIASSSPPASRSAPPTRAAPASRFMAAAASH